MAADEFTWFSSTGVLLLFSHWRVCVRLMMYTCICQVASVLPNSETD